MTEHNVFCLDRGWFSHPTFANEPFTEREAWAWLISEASWKPRRKRVGRTVFDLGRGQLACSERFMAQAWQWDRSKVQRFLRRLKTDQMIDPLTSHDATVITICNYGRYQFGFDGGDPPNDPPNDPLTIHRRSTDDPNEKHYNTITVETEIGSDSARATVDRPAKKTRNRTSLALENPDFEKFWNQYPKKVDIGSARRLYDRIVAEGIATPDELLSGAMRYGAAKQGEDERYTKSPVNWLDGECWLDQASAGKSVGISDNRKSSTKNKADSAIEGMMSYFKQRNET